jgi:ABC-type glycerol-3-phosphate transport system substrate-binding protein
MLLKRLLNITLVLVMISSLLLSSCAAIATPVEPVTLLFVVPQDDKSFYSALIAKFNQQYPEISIDLKTLPGGGEGVLWDVRVVSWDSFTNPSDPTLTTAIDLAPFLAQGAVVKQEDYFSGTLEAFTIEGKLRALPYGLDPWMLFYNRDMFDMAQAQYPQAGWTWNDFVETAAMLTKADEGIYGYAPVNGFVDAFLFIQQHGGRLVDETNKPTFNEPKTLEAMEWYARLYQEYKIAPTPKEALSLYGAGNYGNGMMNSQIAMWIAPLSLRLSNDSSNWKFNLSAVTLPRDETAFTLALFEGYAISSHSKNPDAAWKWVAFLSQEVPFRMMPASKALAESKAYESYIGVDFAEMSRAAMQDAVLPDQEMIRQIGLKMNIFMRVAEQIANGDVEVTTGMDAAQKIAENTQ